MNAVDLVILAGGLGARFGGDKALAAVDGRGQILLEYTLYDVHLAGVERAVLVVREEDEGKFAPLIKRWRGRMEIALAYQTPPSAYGYERTKPLGTGHALLCAQNKVKGDFVLANADDYYGRDAVALAVVSAAKGRPAVVGYPLGETVPREGWVSRAVLVEKEGYLEGIVECRAHLVGERIIVEDGKCRRSLPSSVPVSLNLFALPRSIFAEAGRAFGRFLLEAGEGDECLLTQVVSAYLARGGRVAVLSSPDRWVGMTYSRDRSGVKAYLEGMVRAGFYPEELARG
ncbi:MAG: NTP transferase domain-containing protein [Clostridia bacterium]|nr:NTP transferase domain-containing protein [Clostridia bacterium]